MTLINTRQETRAQCESFGIELHRLSSNELHFVVRDRSDLPLLNLFQELKRSEFYLVTTIGNDERELEDHCFKIYYIFSHPLEDLFLIIEWVIESGVESYYSISQEYPSVRPFEREIADYLGIYSDKFEELPQNSYLHECYPNGLFPLRRDRTSEKLAELIKGYRLTSQEAHDSAKAAALSDGEYLLPVGPIHAGIIEPGHFSFRIAGEAIEGVNIKLGYTHKGIERLFQSNFTLEDGWRLAECISGDSSFAHSMAYCQAVESLAGVQISKETALLRGIFLEMERIANHIGDTSTLALDVAFDIVASETGALREKVMRLNQRVARNRFLRNLNRPGGLILPGLLDIEDIGATLSSVAKEYSGLVQLMINSVDFRDRVINVGVLTKEKGLELGVTGVVARASGIERDYRVQHPFGPYLDEKFEPLIQIWDRDAEDAVDASPIMNGDVFSRLQVRVGEIRASAELIESALNQIDQSSFDPGDLMTEINLSASPNYEFSLGYVEGWRGDIVYWVMKDKFGGIYRCKVRDPSTLNWPALAATVEPHEIDGQRLETMVADFPIVNASFSLSYSGNDL